MTYISSIGLIVGIAVLITLNLKGINGFISALAATIVVIVSNGMNFWEQMSGTFATGVGGFVTSYIFLFCLASAYGELMKTSRSAEVAATWMFEVFGQRWAAVACMLISFVLAFGGINAFIIIFTLYPIAGPLFRKCNISAALLPAIIMYGSINLLVMCPGNPSNLIIALSGYLGTTSYSAPVMSIVLLIIATIFGAWYFSNEVRKNAANGIGYVVKPGDDELMSDDPNVDRPSVIVAFLPLILVIVVKTLLNSVMSITNGLLTAMLVAVVVLIALNFNRLKGHVMQDFTTGFWTSMNTLLVTGSIMGFAAVMKLAPGFVPYQNAASWMAYNLNPYLSAAITINVFSCITGACMAGTQMFVSTMGETFAAMNLNNAGFMRMLSIAAMGLDTLPSSPVLVNTASCCGVTVKECYKYVFMVTVVAPLVLTVISIGLIYIGIV